MSVTRESTSDLGLCPKVCQEPMALPPRTGPAHRGLSTPWSKEAWDKAGSTLPWSGSRGKAEVTLAINVLEDLNAGSAALHRCNCEGF